MNRRLLSFFFLATGSFLLVLTLRHVGLFAIWTTARRAGFFLFPLLLFPLTWNLLQTWAWGRILESLRAPVDFCSLFRVRLAGAAASALLPMSHVVGEPLRTCWLSRFVPAKTAGISVLMDRWLQVAAISGLTSIACVLALRRGLFTNVHPVNLWWIVAVALITGFAVTGYFLRKRWTEEALAAGLAHLLARGAGVIEIYGLGWILGVPLTWQSALFLAALDTAINVVFAPVPANLGVMEGGFAVTAAWLHLDPASGVAIQLLRRMRQIFWNGLGLWAAKRSAFTKCW